jgi:hypothetical protein
MKDWRIPGDPEGIDEPHDVLAAEEFAIPARGDYGLHLPRDPQDEPHDVLAAEEFAIPSGPDRGLVLLKSGAAVNRIAVAGVAALAVLLYALLRRR